MPRISGSRPLSFDWVRPKLVGLSCAIVVYTLPLQALSALESKETNEGYEFSARMVSEIGGRRSEAQLYVQGNKYRIEPQAGISTALGYAGVSIVRFDKREVWLVLSRRRQVLVVPAQREDRLLLAPELDGETKRKLVGPSKAGGRDARLFELEVNLGGEVERYYEWVDAEHGLMLKLMSRDREWLLKYEHVRFNPQPGYFFESPLGYARVHLEKIPKVDPKTNRSQ